MTAIDIVKRLELVGFTSYEAKAYYALLQKNPANGYEVSKRSQVPPSKIYETLQKLKNRGAVIDSQTQPTVYLPVEPSVFFHKIQTETENTIQSLVTDLSALSPAQNFQVTWNLDGTERINEKIASIIDSATCSVYASIWPQQLPWLNPSLAAAMERGVYVVTATFGSCQPAAHETYNLQACAANVLNRTNAMLCTVVTDDTDVIIGELTANTSLSKGIWSQTRPVVRVSKEYIKHDIMVSILTEKIGADACATLLKQHFSDTTAKIQSTEKGMETV